MNNRIEKLSALLKLSHDLANPLKPLSILGEGNTSARLSDKTFLVKTSGSCLGSLRKEDVVECRADLLLEMLDETGLSDAEVDGRLMKSRVDTKSKKPSVEALFHAWLLTLPGIHYVGHTHAPAVNGILCSPRAREFATKRILPDEIVCCDVESVFVPYTDPGLLRLAKKIRTRAGSFMKKYQQPHHRCCLTGKPRHHLTGQNRRGCVVRDADGRKDRRYLAGRGGSRRPGFFITKTSGTHCGTTR